MKTTPFTETHISLGAKMHEFAGYNMLSNIPVSLMNILLFVRVSVCLTSPTWENFWVKGPHALDFFTDSHL